MHTKGSKKAVTRLLNFYYKSMSHFPLSCECRAGSIHRGRLELPEQQVCSVPNTWPPRSVLVGWFYFPLEDSAFQNRYNWNSFSLCVLSSLFFLSIIFTYVCLLLQNSLSCMLFISMLHNSLKPAVCNQLFNFLTFGFRKVQL